MRYEKTTATGALLMSIALLAGGCATKGAAHENSAQSDALPAASATTPAGTCPDRGDPQPDPSRLKYCATEPGSTAPGETPVVTVYPPATADAPPAPRYTLPANATCGGLQPPNTIADTEAGTPGYDAVNSERCAVVVDPATGRAVGNIAAGSPYTVVCVTYQPAGWKVQLPNGVTGEAPFAASTHALVDEGTYSYVQPCTAS